MRSITNFIEKLNWKNGLILPVIVFVGAMLTPVPMERAVYADQLASTISTLYGLIMIVSLFIYGIIIGKEFNNAKIEKNKGTTKTTE